MKRTTVLLGGAVLLFAGAVPSLAADAKAKTDATIWRTPGDITLNDWIWGPGGESQAPKPPFEFIEEDFHGTNPKIKVRDAAGARWTAKFGSENHADVFATRLLYALGYV